MAQIDFPSSPTVGTVFLAGNGVSYQWTGALWMPIGATQALFVGDTPPASPQPNQLWWNSTLGTLFIWYVDPNTSQWVPAAPAGSAIAGATAPLDGYLYGMTLSNNSTTGINFASGKCADSNNATLISNPTSMNKLISATWAAGTGNGGLGNGVTRVANTWYHMFGGLVGGVFDAFYDTSVVGANAPAGFTSIRRLGSVRTGTGGTPPITPFIQTGDWFEWSTWANDLTVNPVANAATNRLIRTPLGLVVMARTNCQLSSTDTVTVQIAISSPAVATPTVTIYQLVTGPNNSVATQIDCLTNTASQIESQMVGTPANNTLYITTVGWTDTRGRDG